MKYPNPTFLQKASGIKHKRRNIAIVIISIITVVTLVCIFVNKVASMQDVYRESFPELVGAATSTKETTTEETTESTTESTTEETTTTETTESVFVPIIASTEETTTESTPATETDEEGNIIIVTTQQDNSPEAFVEAETNTYFKNSHPLQTITHEERDMNLDVLKQYVSDYIKNASGERICFKYVNLATNEELGINELSPIVPAAAYQLPVQLIFWQRIDVGFMSLNSTFTYDGSPVSGGSSWIASTYEPGKMFYARYLANLAITKNDTFAISCIIDRLGGMDALNTRIAQISSYIGYTSEVIYEDYSGAQQKGTNRSSVYDMANFASYLYQNYLNYPSIYQYLINDLAASEVYTPYSEVFGEDALILHVSGRNDELHAYTDVAIIDGKEPIVLVIYAECEDSERATIIFNDLANYVSNFIDGCHN